MPEYFSVEQVARMLQLDPADLLARVEQNEIQAEFGDEGWIIKSSDVPGIASKLGAHVTPGLDQESSSIDGILETAEAPFDDEISPSPFGASSVSTGPTPKSEAPQFEGPNDDLDDDEILLRGSDMPSSLLNPLDFDHQSPEPPLDSGEDLDMDLFSMDEEMPGRTLVEMPSSIVTRDKMPFLGPQKKAEQHDHDLDLDLFGKESGGLSGSGPVGPAPNLEVGNLDDDLFGGGDLESPLMMGFGDAGAETPVADKPAEHLDLDSDLFGTADAAGAEDLFGSGDLFDADAEALSGDDVEKDGTLLQADLPSAEIPADEKVPIEFTNDLFRNAPPPDANREELADASEISGNLNPDINMTEDSNLNAAAAIESELDVDIQPAGQPLEEINLSLPDDDNAAVLGEELEGAASGGTDMHTMMGSADQFAESEEVEVSMADGSSISSDSDAAVLGEELEGAASGGDDMHTMMGGADLFSESDQVQLTTAGGSSIDSSGSDPAVLGDELEGSASGGTDMHTMMGSADQFSDADEVEVSTGDEIELDVDDGAVLGDELEGSAGDNMHTIMGSAAQFDDSDQVELSTPEEESSDGPSDTLVLGEGLEGASAGEGHTMMGNADQFLDEGAVELSTAGGSSLNSETDDAAVLGEELDGSGTDSMHTIMGSATQFGGDQVELSTTEEDFADEGFAPVDLGDSLDEDSVVLEGELEKGGSDLGTIMGSADQFTESDEEEVSLSTPDDESAEQIFVGGDDVSGYDMDSPDTIGTELTDAAVLGDELEGPTGNDMHTMMGNAAQYGGADQVELSTGDDEDDGYGDQFSTPVELADDDDGVVLEGDLDVSSSGDMGTIMGGNAALQADEEVELDVPNADGSDSNLVGANHHLAEPPTVGDMSDDGGPIMLFSGDNSVQDMDEDEVASSGPETRVLVGGVQNLFDEDRLGQPLGLHAADDDADDADAGILDEDVDLLGTGDSSSQTIVQDGEQPPAAVTIEGSEDADDMTEEELEEIQLGLEGFEEGDVSESARTVIGMPGLDDAMGDQVMLNMQDGTLSDISRSDDPGSDIRMATAGAGDESDVRMVPDSNVIDSDINLGPDTGGDSGLGIVTLGDMEEEVGGELVDLEGGPSAHGDDDGLGLGLPTEESDMSINLEGAEDDLSLAAGHNEDLSLSGGPEMSAEEAGSLAGSSHLGTEDVTLDLIAAAEADKRAEARAEYEDDLQLGSASEDLTLAANQSGVSIDLGLDPLDNPAAMADSSGLMPIESVSDLGGDGIEDGGGSGVSLEAAHDEEFVLGGVGGSDITLNAGHSGIGIGGGTSGLGLDDLGTSGLDLEEAAANPGDAGDGEFLLTPVSDIPGDDPQDSGSEVIALDPETDSQTMLGPDGQGVMLGEEQPLGGFGGSGAGYGAMPSGFAMPSGMGMQSGVGLPSGFGMQSGVGMPSGVGGMPAPMPAAGMAPAYYPGAEYEPQIVEAPYSPLQLVSLSFCLLILGLGGLMMFDLVAVNLWEWQGVSSLTQSIMKSVVDAINY